MSVDFSVVPLCVSLSAAGLFLPIIARGSIEKFDLFLIMKSFSKMAE